MCMTGQATSLMAGPFWVPKTIGDLCPVHCHVHDWPGHEPEGIVVSMHRGLVSGKPNTTHVVTKTSLIALLSL